MGRAKDSYEVQRESIEACLGKLGNALVFLHLVQDRVEAARIINGNEQLLSPTVDDCQRAARLIRDAQATISRDWRP